ncbi:hypothetical protein FH5_00636 [Priestia endophytica]|nr:hypothetical protein FH5_00636 [Priestia endophytica]
MMTTSKRVITKPLHGTANDQNTYHFMHEKSTILVSGDQTNGAYCVVKVQEPPKMGPPPHIHANEDEQFHIMKGSFTFFIGGDVIEAKAGDYVHAPRGIKHHFVAGDEVSEMFVTASPAGFDRFIKELGKPVSEDAGLPKAEPPTPEQMKQLVEVAEKFGMNFTDLK